MLNFFQHPTLQVVDLLSSRRRVEVLKKVQHDENFNCLS
jgi:hypothetical protein